MFGGSAEGISFLSVFLELLAISFCGVYSYSSGFPFSAYGEAVFLAIQVTGKVDISCSLPLASFYSICIAKNLNMFK